MKLINRHVLSGFLHLSLWLGALFTLLLPVAGRFAAAEPAEPVAVSITYLPVAVSPQQPVAVLQNANFESGRTGWAEFSNDGQAVIRTDQPVVAHSGRWVAWLGGSRNNISSITQQVTVPATAPYLAYYHYIASTDLCGYDKAYVLAGATQVTTYELCTDNKTNGWVKRVVNLSAYAGQSVALQFRVTTDASLNSNLFIDDVGFQSGPALNAAALAGDQPDTGSLIFKSGETEVTGSVK
jgi:hypothetical protein